MKKKLSVLLPVFALALAAGIAVRVGFSAYQNHKLQVDFKPHHRMTGYLEGVPIAEMDMDKYRWLIDFVNMSDQDHTTFTTDRPITYYEEVDGEKVLAYEIPAGTTLTYWPFWDVYFGYGYNSYPTYEKGWRYTRPFIEPGGAAKSEELPFYYVKLSDLEHTVRLIIKSDKNRQEALRYERKTVQDVVYSATRFTDAIFYVEGVYISPDYLHPLWTWDCTAMAAALAAALTAWAVLRAQAKKKGQSE